MTIEPDLIDTGRKPGEQVGLMEGNGNGFRL